MLYFKQIEIGPMQNYVYLIGSAETRKVAVVDAAWEIDTILKIAAQDDVEITHAFVTHTHPDHVGGRFSGAEIPGVNELLTAPGPAPFAFTAFTVTLTVLPLTRPEHAAVSPVTTQVPGPVVGAAV